MFARYAKMEVASLLGGGAVVSALVAWGAGWWALAPAGVAAALLSFYRDPPRKTPADARAVFAPADGRIVTIEPVEAGPEGGRALRIVVFLSVFNVHVNRSPCAGRVARVDYKPGKYVNALRGEADVVNESNAVEIEPAEPLPGPIRVRQISGALAKRIVCAVGPGARLRAGERYGMIKLGSRTEIVLPNADAWEVCVRVGDRARGGRTVLARVKREAAAVGAALETPATGGGAGAGGAR